MMAVVGVNGPGAKAAIGWRAGRGAGPAGHRTVAQGLVVRACQSRRLATGDAA